MWSYVAVVTEVAIVLLLSRRERATWPRPLAKIAGVEQLSDGGIQRGISHLWAMAFLAARPALMAYLATGDHALRASGSLAHGRANAGARLRHRHRHLVRGSRSPWSGLRRSAGEIRPERSGCAGSDGGRHDT